MRLVQYLAAILIFLVFVGVIWSILGSGPLDYAACASACEARGHELVNVNFGECTCSSSDTPDGLVTLWLH